jgi:hypothetical protein
VSKDQDSEKKPKSGPSVNSSKKSPTTSPSTKTPRKPFDDRSPECKEALALVDKICETIEDDVPDRAKEQNGEYFEDVEEKAKSIGLTVETSRHATPGQLNALANMLQGIEKWLR